MDVQRKSKRTADRSEWTRRIVREAKKHGAKLALPPRQPDAKEKDRGDTIT